MFGLPDWLTTPLAVVGILAAGSVFISLFFALGRRPSQLGATRTPPPQTPEFLQAIAGAVNSTVQAGGTAVLLENGDEVFPAILEAISAARATINFMVYIWEPGQVSDLFLEALATRAAAGVQVRVLLDGLGGIRAPGDGLDRLREAGGRVARFRPPRFGWLTRFHKRNHRRAIVIDGEVGFTGGVAVSDRWLGHAQDPRHWRDTMVRVTGPLAANLQSAFAELWAYCAGEILVGEGFYPAHWSPVHMGPTDPIRHVGVISSPASEEHPLRLFFMLSFLAARRRLYIVTPYFVPDRHMRAAIMDRARHGVDVRILLPGPHTDALPIRLASHSYYAPLLSAGVRIYEYQPTMIHTKAITIDGRWSIVGSANIDIRSKELNQENVLGILDPGLTRELEEMLFADLRRAREIRLEDWRRRGIGWQLLESIAVLFAEQY